MPLTQREADKLITVIKDLAIDKEPLHGIDLARGKDKTVMSVVEKTPDGPRTRLMIDADQVEAIYHQIKNRLIDDLRVDPILLQLLAQRPEIILEIEPQTITLDAKTLKGRIAMLLSAGWMKQPRATSAIRRELARTGADPGGGGTLSEKLRELQREGFLTSEGDGWTEAPGIKISEKTLQR